VSIQMTAQDFAIHLGAMNAKAQRLVRELGPAYRDEVAIKMCSELTDEEREAAVLFGRAFTMTGNSEMEIELVQMIGDDDTAFDHLGVDLLVYPHAMEAAWDVAVDAHPDIRKLAFDDDDDEDEDEDEDEEE